MDFKIIGPGGNLVATADGACEARAKMQGELVGRHVLLDDTGIEVSESDLDVLCAAERSAERPDAR